MSRAPDGRSWKTIELPERFWLRVNRPDNPDACWLWAGRLKANGYSELYVDGKQVMTHRYAYELLVGAIPPGLTIDHLCRNPACVNPAHLEPVPIGENIRRGTAPPAQNARKTHCLRGHPYDEANTRIARSGKRECRMCGAIRIRAYRSASLQA